MRFCRLGVANQVQVIVLVIIIGACLLRPAFAFGQESPNFTASPNLLTVQPGNLLTIHVQSSQPDEFRLMLPDGVEPIGSAVQKTRPTQSNSHRVLYSVYIPGNYRADTYTVYIQSEKTGRSKEHDLIIQPVRDLNVSVVESPKNVRAGSKAQYQIMLHNQGNVDLDLETTLTGALSGKKQYKFIPETITLPAGNHQLINLQIQVPLDAPQQKYYLNRVKLTGNDHTGAKIKKQKVIDFMARGGRRGRPAPDKRSMYRSIDQSIRLEYNHQKGQKEPTKRGVYRVDGMIADSTSLKLKAEKSQGSTARDNTTEILLERPNGEYQKGRLSQPGVAQSGDGDRLRYHVSDDISVEGFSLEGLNDERVKGAYTPYQTPFFDGEGLWVEKDSIAGNRYHHRLDGTVRTFNNIPINWQLLGHYYDGSDTQTVTPGFGLQTGWRWFNHTVRLNSSMNQSFLTTRSDATRRADITHNYDYGPHQYDFNLAYDRNIDNWFNDDTGRGGQETDLTIDANYEYQAGDYALTLRALEERQGSKPFPHSPRHVMRSGVGYDSSVIVWGQTIDLSLNSGYEYHSPPNRKESHDYYLDLNADHRYPLVNIGDNSVWFTNTVSRTDDAERINNFNSPETTRLRSGFEYDPNTPWFSRAQYTHYRESNGRRTNRNVAEVQAGYNKTIQNHDLSIQSDYVDQITVSSKRWDVEGRYQYSFAPGSNFSVNADYGLLDKNYQVDVSLSYNFSTPALWSPQRGNYSGRVYFDKNQSGKFEPEKDPPIRGAKIQLSGTSHYTKSDTLGYYSMKGVEPGTYKAVVTLPAHALPGQIINNPDTVTVKAGEYTHETRAATKLGIVNLKLNGEVSSTAKRLGLDLSDQSAVIQATRIDGGDTVTRYNRIDVNQTGFMYLPSGTYKIKVFPQPALGDQKQIEPEQTQNIIIQDGKQETVSFTIKQVGPEIKSIE